MAARPANDTGALLRELPLLARLGDSDVRALAVDGRPRRFGAGEIIFREGDPGDSMHVVVEGEVRIGVLSGSGEEATFALFGRGECFGELALLDGRSRSANAVATKPTKTWLVTRTAFRKWLRERPDAASALLETLSLRLRRTNENLSDLMFLDLQQRLAKRLLEIAHPVTPSGPLRASVTQAELGALLGVSRESVNKQLNALARAGLVRIGRGSVTILDEAGVRAGV
jgi:CRP-like cAMP-binding protein